MKIFKVTGWTQFMTDCAKEVNRVQLAESADQAIEDVVGKYNKETRYKLEAKEI